jgi:hypothetical protein
MSKRKPNMGDFDHRIRWYHLLKKPWVLTIWHVGVETMPDRFQAEAPRGEIVTETQGEFNPYAPRPERKRGEPLPEKEMPVLWFDETKSRKSLVLNSTNRRALIAAYGTDPDAWKGVVVTLAAGKTPQGKDTVILTIGGDVKTQTPAESVRKEAKG